MPWNTILETIRVEITEGERRATTQAGAVTTLITAGSDSVAAEQALFRELDSLLLMRARQRAIEFMQLDGNLATVS